MGATLYTFPNELRKHRSKREQQRRQDRACGQLDDTGNLPDPARTVSTEATVREHLASLKPRTRAVVALHLDGYSHEEIKEVTGVPTVRAVEAILYRWRTTEQARRRACGYDEGGESS